MKASSNEQLNGADTDTCERRRDGAARATRDTAYQEWKFPFCARVGAIQAAITLSDNDMIGSGASKVKTNGDTRKSREKAEAGARDKGFKFRLASGAPNFPGFWSLVPTAWPGPRGVPCLRSESSSRDIT